LRAKLVLTNHFLVGKNVLENKLHTPQSEATDFDFLVGRWNVKHRRLRQRLEDCHEWDEFDGTSEVRNLMNGHANVDDNVLELPQGHYRAVTLRSFDPKTAQWAIWWLDARHPHQLDVPMIGSFSAGVGTFYADDQINGRPIRVRFLWSDITAESCRWQQAFSVDSGKTWETNWIMNFRRITENV
jgi:hypothetical protein